MDADIGYWIMDIGYWIMILVSGKEEAVQGQGPLHRNQAA